MNMLKIGDEDISFAFRQVTGDCNQINWVDYFELHNNQELLNFAAVEGVGAAKFKGPKGSEGFLKELSGFRYILNFGFSAIYSAMNSRLPKVEKRHIDEVLKKPYSEVEAEAELKERHEFLGQLIPKWGREMTLHGFTQYAIFLVLKSVFVAADEEIRWLEEKLKELKI